MAALVAQNQGAKTMINLSNIDYVYNKDPKKFKDAQIIKEIKWSDFRKIVGNTWTPGLNMPFDPIASKLCQKNKTQVLIMNGSKLDKVKDFLNGRGFVGTLIK
jgi:uridylate kinase